MQVTKQYYNDTQMTDSNSLSAALLSRAEELSPIITHLAGKDSQKFPLTTLTEGSGNVKSIEKGEYEYRVQTRLNQTRPLNSTNANSNVGMGGASFVLNFPDKWFVFPYTLYSPSGVMARIMDQPKESPNGGYDYVVKLVDPDPAASVPASDLQAGALWGQMFANVELYYWYGAQTYTEAGNAHILDENNQPVISGPGLLDQILNKDTYSKLTTNKLKQVVRDIFFGMTDGENRTVTLYTGTGGIDEFDSAIKDTLAAQTYIKLTDGKFVSGSGRALSYGGFFTQYQHVDGHTINVVKVPLFDHGVPATVSPKHPETGLPMESYRMVFVDQSRYDGENNVQMINRKGREMLRWAVAGSTIPAGFSGNDLRASDIDGASVHYLKTSGVLLRRFDTSLDLRCVAS